MRTSRGGALDLPRLLRAASASEGEGLGDEGVEPRRVGRGARGYELAVGPAATSAARVAADGVIARELGLVELAEHGGGLGRVVQGGVLLVLGAEAAVGEGGEEHLDLAQQLLEEGGGEDRAVLLELFRVGGVGPVGVVLHRPVHRVLEDDGGARGRLACGDEERHGAREEEVGHRELAGVLDVELVLGQPVGIGCRAHWRRPSVALVGGRVEEARDGGGVAHERDHDGVPLAGCGLGVEVGVGGVVEHVVCPSPPRARRRCPPARCRPSRGRGALPAGLLRGCRAQRRG